MDPKLKAILQKAKEIDIKARKYDSVDTSVLESNVNSRVNNNGSDSGLYDQIGTKQSAVMSETTTQVKPNISSDSKNYNQRVKESKLPPEIMKAMLDNPIPQPDMPGTFSMDEETIKEINPNYGKEVVNTISESRTHTQTPHSRRPNPQPTLSEASTRKMIAEEIAKALPSIVEKYFDKKMIQENIEVLKSLKIKRKTTNNRK